jgi:RecJ-like exonuclease
MFGRFRRRRAERERQARWAGPAARDRRAARSQRWADEGDWDEREQECPVCWGYGSVECRRCNETGDLDPTNDRDLDCHYCQGWGAVTCTYCGGSGRR